MRPIRNPAKPPLRRRAPRLPGPGRALPGASRSPVGAARPDAPAPHAPRTALAGRTRSLRAPLAPDEESAAARVGPLGAARSRAKPRQPRRTAWVLSGGTRRARVCQCVRGGADVCVRLSRVWHGRAAACIYIGRGIPLVQDSAGRRRVSPRYPRALRPSRTPCAQPGLPAPSGLQRATLSLTSRPELLTASAAPQLLNFGGLGRLEDPQYPRSRARRAPGATAAFPARPVPVLEPRDGCPSPAHPACDPRHSQVAAAGQDEKDLRAIDGEERAARRQQEHDGPALLAGLRRPRGQSAWAS